MVLPEQGAALALTAESGPTQEVLDLFWDAAFPAIGRPGSADADARLARRLDRLTLPAVSGAGTGPDRARLRRRGEPGELGLATTYTDVSVWRAESGHVLLLRRGGDWLELRVGDGEWLESVLELADLRLPVVASGGWVNGDQFVAEVLVIETPWT
jgi:hypothetical protein